MTRPNPFPEGGQPTLNHRLKARKWVLTVFNLKKQLSAWQEWLVDNPQIKDCFWGVENAPQQGTPHAHVGIWLNEQMRFADLRRALSTAESGPLSAWISPMNGTWEEAEDYAHKDPSHTDDSVFQTDQGPVPTRRRSKAKDSKGSQSQKKSSQLADAAIALSVQGRRDQALLSLTASQAVSLAPKLSIASQLSPPRAYAPLCVWLYGPSGVGKTLMVQSLAAQLRCSVHFADLKADSKFWNGYCGQEMLVLDEVRPETLPFQLFLRLVNSAPFQVEVKNYFVPITSPLIVITSPSPPFAFWSEAVDQRGHLNDIFQARRRLNVVAQVLGPQTSQFVIRKLCPWTAPAFQAAQTPILPPALGELLENFIHTNDLPGEWCVQSTSQTKPQSIVLDENHRLLTVKPLTLTLIPMKSAQCASLDAQEECDQENSSGNASAPHWTELVRLPEGLREEVRAEMIQTLTEMSHFETSMCVEHRNFDLPLHLLLEQHYFGDLFF